MKKSFISVLIFTSFITSAHAQMRNIPGFDDTNTTPTGPALGGSMSGSTGATIPVTPGIISDQQRMEERNDTKLNVPPTEPNIPRSRPTGTGIDSGIEAEPSITP